jgi:hypothetical protein
MVNFKQWSLDELVAERSLKIPNNNNRSGPEIKMKNWIKSAVDSEDKSCTFSIRGTKNNNRVPNFHTMSVK